jgi:hypothetical protein
MDPKARKKLVDDFVDPKKKNFEATFSKGNQRWFVEKVLGGALAAGQADAAATAKVRDVIIKSRAIAVAQRDFALALTAGDNARFSKRLLAAMRKHRVEILYGAIAHNTELAEPARLGYLLLTAKRRFRAICRMYCWVNPNGQGYFRYPHRCPADQTWRVNEDAKPFWEPFHPPPAFGLPIRLKLQANGDRDPVTGLSKMFVRKDNACKGNLLDCSSVAALLFMDAVNEAKDPAKLLKKLATFANYMQIKQLSLPGGATFQEDGTAEGMMEQLARPARDLQVGDHMYIFNHPLYKTFRPTGSWRGEHSLVYISGDRNYKSQSGFVFGGHGKNGTLYQFYDAFVSELKTHLAFARQLMTAHLAFMRGGAAAILPGTVLEEEHPVSVDRVDPATGNRVWAPAVPFRMLSYDAAVKARDFTKVPTRTNRKPKAGPAGFLVLQSKTEDVFYLDGVEKHNEDISLEKNIKKTIGEVWPPGKTHFAIKFVRVAPAPAGSSAVVRYDPKQWGVVYADLSAAAAKTWPFFVADGAKMKRKELTLDDLFDSPFNMFVKAGSEVRVTQPKVNFTPAHQTFLTTNGAL